MSSSTTDAEPAAPSTSVQDAAASTAVSISTGDVVGFAASSIDIGGVELLVAVADTPDLRHRGLREVEDLGDLDGMLFVFADPGPVSFTMQDTWIALDLLVFTADGVMIDRIAMTPCRSDPCPLYPAGQAVAQAVEIAAGTFPELVPGAALSVKGPA